jgi:hypothetical protein
MVTRLPVDLAAIVVGPVVSRVARMLTVARDHPLATLEAVSVEDIAMHHVFGVDEIAPPELADPYVPATAPSGRPIRRLRAPVNDFSELVILIARGRVVQPTVASAVPLFAHPNIVSVPISDMPPSNTALAWRRRASDPRLRALIDTARELLRTAPSLRGPPDSS